MNLKRSIILFSLIFLHITLSFAQNKVVAKEFSNVYILPIEIQDKTFHFLFDTGASQSVINEEALQELKIRHLDSLDIPDAYGNYNKLGLIDLGIISIGNKNFNDIEFLTLPEEGNSYRDAFGCQEVDGVIGFDIIKSVKWKINWSTKTFEIGDNLTEWDLDNYEKIKLDVPKNGSKAIIKIKANGKKFYARLDSGNNSFLSLGDRTYNYLHSKLDNLSTTSKKGRTSTGVYGQNYGVINYTFFENIKIDKLALENRIVANSGTKHNLLGTGFLKDYITIIDLQDEKMFVSRNADVAKSKDEIRKFPVDIQPDYKTRELMISNIWEQHSSGSNFENETKVIKINDTDVSSFTKEQLCHFWDNDWKTLRALDQLELVIETSEGTSKFSIKKENLLSTNS